MASPIRHNSQRNPRLWLCLLLIASMSRAQDRTDLPEHLPKLTQYDHKVWTVRDGAPAHIIDISLSHNGTLWVATLQGLYNFDGFRFTPFRSAPGGRSMPVGGYETVLEARNGDVWAGSIINGIVRIRHGEVTVFGKAEGFPSLTVVQILEAPGGAVWAVVNGAAMVFNGQRWVDGGVGGGVPNEGGVKALFADRAGTLWLSTARSLYYRRRGQPQFTRTNVAYARGEDPSAFAETANGDLWLAIDFTSPAVGTDLRKLDVPGHRTGSPQQVTLPFLVDELLLRDDGSLWVTGGDLVRFAPSADHRSFRLEYESLGTAQGLSSKQTTTSLEDGRGDVWLATDGGLERFQEPRLMRYVDRPLNPTDLGLTSDGRGNVWIGSEGLPLLSVQDGQTAEHGPVLSRAGMLHVDGSGAVWAKTKEGMVSIVNNRPVKIPPPDGFPTWSPRQVFETRDGQLYLFCLPYGLFKRTGETWVPVHLPGQPIGAPMNFFVDRQNRIWIGYVSGEVGLVAAGNGRVLPVGTGTALNTIQTFAETTYGLLCGGFNGLAVLRGDRFQPLPSQTPQATEGASGLLQAANGDLWINGLNGVARIRGADLQAAIEHGQAMPAELFQQTEIAGPSPQTYGFPTAVADAAGKLWFNTSGTVVSINPAHLPHDTRPPVLTVTALEQDGTPAAPGNTIRAGAVTVRIPYFGADLYAPDEVTYRYQLRGVDKSWQDVAHRTEAVYTHLQPARYTFEVQAMSGQGVWSQPVVTTFTVLPRFYQTAWFRLLAALAFATLFYLLYRWRVDSISRRMEDLAEAKADERLRITRDLHDTLLQGLQGLLLSFEAGTRLLPADSPAYALLHRALTRAGDQLVEGRARFQDLRAGAIGGADLASALRVAGEDLNQDGAIQFKVESNGTAGELPPGLADEVYLIAREALRNAFTHAGAGQIEAALHFSRSRFQLTIFDDGTGIHPPSPGEAAPHFGLLGMRERAARIGGDLTFTQGPDRGTTVQLTVRVDRRRMRLGNLLRRLGQARAVRRVD